MTRRTFPNRAGCPWQLSTFVHAILLLSLALPALLNTPAVAQQSHDDSETLDFETLETQFEQQIQPLLKQHCLDCHNADALEGDLDLARFHSFRELRNDANVWQLVEIQVDSGEMPPASDVPFTDQQRKTFLDWTRRYLRAEAYAGEGDPGAIVLRRLSNSEYTYSIRDLTRVDSLNPTAEFPVDGAAGEGFTNASAALVMSPALFAKYLDAAKQVAEHLVLIPDGVEFSPSTTSRDWTEEKLAAIRQLYARYSERGDAVPLSLQGVQFASQDAGVIPLEKYLLATIEYRQQLQSDRTNFAGIAAERQLSQRYLTLLFDALSSEDPSLLLQAIRQSWEEATPQDAATLAAQISRWQEQLWSFAPVGHIGKKGGPSSWQQPLMPLVESQAIEFAFPAAPTDRPNQPVTFYFAAASPTAEKIQLTWQQPRLVLPNGSTLLLRDAASRSLWIEQTQQTELARTEDYLRAIALAHTDNLPLEDLATQHSLIPELLNQWGRLLQLGRVALPTPTGHYTQQLSNVGGYQTLRGWGSHETPSLLTNSANDELRFSTLRVPGRSVVVHPSPSQESVVYWQSPLQGEIVLDGLVADADPNCGNGFAWNVQQLSREGAITLANGVVDNGGTTPWSVQQPIAVRKSDLIKFVINPRDREHACDTTHISLTIREHASGDQQPRTWDLANDIVDRIHEGNPLPDSYDNATVWHFGSHSITPTTPSLLVPDSSLATWRNRVIAGATTAELNELAASIKTHLTTTAIAELPAADQAVRKQVLDWHGPMAWLSLAGAAIDPATTSADFLTTTADAQSIQLPAALLANAKLMTTVQLVSASPTATAQAWVSTERPTGLQLTNLRPAPLLIVKGSTAEETLTQQIRSFQQLFPAALCYTKIVPIDEVVTLQILYREDEAYRRLMLSDAETVELDRLWDQLRFVSQEPLKMVDVFEQLWQYATQDADPSAFEPLREPIRQRAEQFRQQMVAAETPQLEAMIQFAEQAWRRPLQDEEQQGLRELYHRLRADELAHDAAIRLTLARILTAPEFLYKLEAASDGTKPTPLSNHEIATRLSYFLWSSTPDDELHSLATQGRLRDAAVIDSQVERLLRDPRARRLAIEFGCQWLGVRDFNMLDEKSESQFPEFVDLRSDMYEETIRFFADFFQHDRSILSLLDADHTFVNAELAQFYGLPSLPSDQWQRVDGVRQHGRGGILGLATTLAKQSGASRTSPILRGNWVFESLLGMHLPKPPAGVPQLPDTLPEGLTERELIERHSSSPACAHCHAKIDPYGFALESYDAIGRWRNGAKTSATLPDGAKIDGLDGMRRYLLNSRRDAFVRQFCRKLLGFALGRSVQLADEPLLDKMMASLKDNDYRISAAIKPIVHSPQFLLIRGKDASDPNFVSTQP